MPEKKETKPQNPARESLEGVTKFPIRCWFDLVVKVEDEPSTFNGQETGQRRGEAAAVQFLAKLLAAVDWKKRAKKGIKAEEVAGSENLESPFGEAGVWNKDWAKFEGRCFKDQLFCGSGDYSSRNTQILKVRLDEAVSFLSAMQQNGGMGYAFDHSMDKKAKRYIENVVKDVAMALTGAEWHKAPKNGGKR